MHGLHQCGLVTHDMSQLRNSWLFSCISHVLGSPFVKCRNSFSKAEIQHPSMLSFQLSLDLSDFDAGVSSVF